MIARTTLALLGAAVGVYGAYLLLSRQVFDQLLSAAIWLAGGVILHDFVFTAVVLLVGVVGARVVPRAARKPAVVGAVVLVSVTAVAFPMLGRFGARTDNDTLLDRSYLTSWFVLVAVVAVAVAVAALVRARSHRSAVAAAETNDESDPDAASTR